MIELAWLALLACSGTFAEAGQARAEEAARFEENATLQIEVKRQLAASRLETAERSVGRRFKNASTIRFVRGEVAWSADGHRWREAKDDAKPPAPFAIQTGEASQVVVVLDRKGDRPLVQLLENGLVLIEPLEMAKPGPPPSLSARLHLLKGHLQGITRKREQGTRVVIQTPVMQAEIGPADGAEFSICGHGRAATITGRVVVTHQGNRHVVNSGECFVPGSTPPVSPTPMAEVARPTTDHPKKPLAHYTAPQITGETTGSPFADGLADARARARGWPPGAAAYTGPMLVCGGCISGPILAPSIFSCCDR